MIWQPIWVLPSQPSVISSEFSDNCILWPTGARDRSSIIAWTIITSANLSLAQIGLANLDGTPLTDTRITFYNDYVPGLVTESIGVLGRTVEMVTDQAGHAEMLLVKGSTVSVTIVGTGISRQIVVPSTSSFDVMDEIATADDLFEIQVPDIPAAVRRS